ncbi:MAG: rod-binding protein [Bacteriovoracaceae bacterium]|nr:rod-binding protein [Bacteriovoracaceae bacterium]
MSNKLNSLTNNPAYQARARQAAAKYENVPKEYMDVAQGMETQFINHMLNEMRKTVKSSEPDSSASKYYKGLVDHERAKIMATTDNGIGLKDVILDQIYPKHMRVGMPSKHAINAYQQEVDSKQGDGNE